MPAPLFTVVTANYNSGDKLAASVASVLAQGVDAVEHLIVDGASKDDSLPLARRLAEASSGRVRVVSEADRGVYDAMNKGVDLAAGRYIYFLGAGDLLRPEALRAVADTLPRHDRGLIYGDAWLEGRVYDGPFSWLKLTHQNICHQAIFYGRDVFQLVGRYDLTYRFWADWDFNLRCFGNRRVRPAYLPVVIADFEMGGISRHGDARFTADLDRLVRRNLGLARYARWRLRGIRKPVAWFRALRNPG